MHPWRHAPARSATGRRAGRNAAVSYKQPRRDRLLSVAMELLKDAPAGYDDIAKAFAMARHLPTTHRLDLRVGLVHDGELFARGCLDGYRQVTFFSEHLRHLGWREHLLGGDDEMFDCDMVFSQPADADTQADPSFIRRPPVELWPVRSGHEHAPE